MIQLPVNEHAPAPGSAHQRFVITDDHRYRTAALAVPGAMWSKTEQAYVVDNPTPRAAAAMIALFPHSLVKYPELTAIRDRDYGDARPHDFASELAMSLELPAEELGGRVLYNYQDLDLGYLHAIARRDGGAFIGWDRGLGKTTATAAIIAKTEAQRSIIITRNDTKEAVWKDELSLLLPEHDLVVLPNEKKKREKTLASLAEQWAFIEHGGLMGGNPGKRPLVFIIHYEAIALIAGEKGRGKGWDKLGRWDVMAYDEGHRLATYNPNSNRNTQMGRGLSKLRKHVDLALNLTGSPVMNHPEDLFGQLHYLFPTVYKAKWRDWNNRFIDYVDDGHRRVPIGFKHEELPRLRQELGVFMVYRTKAEVFKDLPPLIHENLELDLYPRQREAYDDMLEQFWAVLEEGGLKAANALSQLNYLRRIATYVPGLPSVKLDYTLKEIEATPDEQFVVFTWYKEPGRALAEALGDEVVVVDGDVPIRHRPELLRRHKEGQARVLVGSIATLGESLNLQYAHNAIRLDRDWNPQKNAQTLDRLYRNGQQDTVVFQDLWAKETVDTLRVKPNLASKDSLRKAVFG